MLIVMTVGLAVAKLVGVQVMRVSAEHFGSPWNRCRIIGTLELAAAAAVSWFAFSVCWPAGWEWSVPEV
jgi:hypothetical protein